MMSMSFVGEVRTPPSPSPSIFGDASSTMAAAGDSAAVMATQPAMIDVESFMVQLCGWVRRRMGDYYYELNSERCTNFSESIYPLLEEA